MPEPPKLPPVAAEPLSLVLLAHNAETHVGEVVRAWAGFLQARGKDHEVLLVDDGSTDRTPELAEGLAAETPGLKVLRHDRQRGTGAALRTGLEAAALPLVAYAPCEPEYTPEGLAQLLAGIDRAHLVSGYRAGRRVPWPLRGLGLLLRLCGRVVFGSAPEPLPGWLGWRRHLAAWLARAVYGVRLRDVGSPFRLLRREGLARAPIQSDGDFAQVELPAKANFADCIYDEVPLPIRPRPVELTAARLRQLLREASAVFSHPDFGPAKLPESLPTVEAPAAERMKEEG